MFIVLSSDIYLYETKYPGSCACVMWHTLVVSGWNYFILYHSPNDPLIYRHFLFILSHPGSLRTIRTVSNTLGIKSVDSIWIMELVVMLPVTTLLTWSPPLVAKAGTKARRCGWEESRLCLTGSYLRSHHYDQSARCLKPPLLILNVTPPLKLGAANFKL